MLGNPRMRSIDDIFGDIFGGDFRLDARDEGGNIVIRADLPGISKDDINVTFEKGVLTISATRESHTCGEINQETDGNVYVQERRFGSFSRVLNLQAVLLPSGISDDIHASLKDGVLQIILKRTEASKPRKIEIS